MPTFDADGNQTKVKTSTGIWNVVYNAENRPVTFTSEDGATVVECTYDYMGRRHTRKITVNGSVTNYLRYIYRGYLQIAAINAVSGVFQWFILWDPTQSVATRPLGIRKDGTWYTYGWDLTKNICEVFGSDGYIKTAYTYTPYGSVTATGNVTQPIQWSSEYNDTELGLVYYNYRHYNPVDGRWIGRDPIQEKDKPNLYSFVGDQAVSVVDSLGLKMQKELTIDSCLDLKAKVISNGFWGKTETPLRNGDTVYLRRGFTIVYTGVWKSNGYCQKKRKEFFQCFPYRVIAEFSYKGKAWKSSLTQYEYKTIYGRVEREEVSRGQAVFGNGGHSDLYILSGGFGVNDYQLKGGGKVEVLISQDPGDFESKQSYTFVFDSDMSRFAWNSHRIG